MQTRQLPVILGLWLFLISPVSAQNSQHESEPSATYPSEEMLEFLADFGDIDNETFDIIEFHAQQDIASPRQEKSDEN